MSDRPLNNDNTLCKYDDYLHPDTKKNIHQFLGTSYNKKLSTHKHRLSGILPPFINQPIQNNLQNSMPNRNISSIGQQSIPLNRNTSTKNLDSNKKSQNLKLESLFPKSVTIKFQDVLNCIPNNRKANKSSKNHKLSKTISPFKIFQIAQTKFYLQLFNQKKKQQEEVKQKYQTKNNIDPLFNVRSIKMIKKISDTLPLRDEYSQILKQKIKQNKKSKYDKNFKNQTDLSLQYEKENLKKNIHKKTNFVKLSLKQIKKFQQFQSSTNIKSKRQQLLPLSQVKNREQKCKEKYDCKSHLIDQKSDNRSSSMIINKKTNMKELTPMVFSLKQDLNLSMSNSKLFDNRSFINKKTDLIFQQKINKYTQLLKSYGQIYEIQIIFPENCSRNQFNFYVGKGNNSKLVKQTLKKRWWIGTCEDKKDLQKNNIVWTQLKDKSYYSLKFNNEVQKQSEDSKLRKKLIIHNHFQQNQFLGNKKALFYNMSSYYKSINQDVFNYLPLTFHIANINDQAWKSFLNYYQKVKQENPNQKNIWILKPGQNTNRGNGITVHQNIQTIKNVIGQSLKSGRTYILQKYIERPFLYNKRKFDIRCYMLLVRLGKSIKGFWYKEGYIRTSGYEFTLQDCTNSFIHLTNDAIQQNCDNYGKYEDKNKLSYQRFQKYLDMNFNNIEKKNNNQGQNKNQKYDFERDIIPKIRKVCIDSIKASYKCLGKYRQGLPTFQLFGLDFMIDEDFNPWLIEINTNPCLETQGRVLEKVIVPLIDNVFKLTIDCIFPPPLNWSNSNKHLLSKNVDKNNFELVFDEQKEEINNKNDQIKQAQLAKIGEIDEDNEVYDEQQEQ